MQTRSGEDCGIHQAEPRFAQERQRSAAVAAIPSNENTGQAPQPPKLERVEVPPYKNKVWQMFEVAITDKLSTIKEEASKYDPDMQDVATDLSAYFEEVIKALAPNFRKLTTTLYDSEATATKLACSLSPTDEGVMLALKKENAVLLEGIKFNIAKCAALQRKSVGDTQKQATAMYSNSLAQVQKEFEGLTDPTESAGAAMENALKDQTTVHNIRWKKTVSGHNQTCNEGVQRVSEGVKLYQQIRKLMQKKELAWSTEWTHPADYEAILQETDSFVSMRKQA